MEIKLAQLYNQLAKQTISMIPDKWQKIYYLGEVEKGMASCSSVFYYVDSTGRIIECNEIPEVYKVPKSIFLDLMAKLNRILLEIYECFQNNEQDLWEQLTLFINSEGKFKIDFEYNVMNDDDGGQVMRETLWAYKTFAYKPKEGTYMRKLLEKWIKEHDKEIENSHPIQ